MQVKKRNGIVVSFDEEKIQKAVEKALVNNIESIEEIENISKDVSQRIRTNIIGLKLSGNNIVDVEKIQDMVEYELMVKGLYDIAKKYILYRESHKQSRNLRLRPDKNIIHNYMTIGRYSRYVPELQRRETFNEAVNRVRDMHIKKYPMIANDITWAFEQVKDTVCLPSMRSLQFGGSAIEKVNPRLYNCTFSVCDRISFFSECLYLLLCGCGVGFSVEFEYVDKLSKLNNNIDESIVKHITIDDSIEGWANALKELINSYVHGYLAEFNYSEIRPRGQLLKTSGGRAPGHVPLRKALEKCRVILDNALGRQLKPIECYDIVMYIADAVISGGVRRSATICLFSPDDGEMMNAKTGNWYNENPQRARSNNSVKLIRSEVNKAQFLRIFNKQKEWGEPGFYFAEDMKHGTNPCCEIGMSPFIEKSGVLKSGWQFCNLTEINGAKLIDEESFKIAIKAATIIGTCQAGYTSFPYLGKITEEICEREALLGISITGMMDNPDIALNPEIQTKMAKYAIEVNKDIAEKIGINSAARLTCVKPAGSTSLVLGTASGIHPRHARRYFRRIQANITDPVYKYFKSINPHMCESSVWSNNGTDDVITFCVESPENALTRKDISALRLLEYVRSTQMYWVREGTAKPELNPGLYHNVSNTITVKDSEWNDVAEYIWKHRDSFTGVALLHETGDKAYKQAPHEEIVTIDDELKWNNIIEKYTPVDFTNLKEFVDSTNLKGEAACAGGACEII